jgi:hypothetical protein
VFVSRCERVRVCVFDCASARACARVCVRARACMRVCIAPQAAAATVRTCALRTAHRAPRARAPHCAPWSNRRRRPSDDRRRRHRRVRARVPCAKVPIGVRSEPTPVHTQSGMRKHGSGGRPRRPPRGRHHAAAKRCLRAAWGRPRAAAGSAARRTDAAVLGTIWRGGCVALRTGTGATRECGGTRTYLPAARRRTGPHTHSQVTHPRRCEQCTCSYARASADVGRYASIRAGTLESDLQCSRACSLNTCSIKCAKCNVARCKQSIRSPRGTPFCDAESSDLYGEATVARFSF